MFALAIAVGIFGLDAVVLTVFSVVGLMCAVAVIFLITDFVRCFILGTGR